MCVYRCESVSVGGGVRQLVQQVQTTPAARGNSGPTVTPIPNHSYKNSNDLALKTSWSNVSFQILVIKLPRCYQMHPTPRLSQECWAPPSVLAGVGQGGLAPTLPVLHPPAAAAPCRSQSRSKEEVDNLHRDQASLREGLGTKPCGLHLRRGVLAFLSQGRGCRGRTRASLLRLLPPPQCHLQPEPAGLARVSPSGPLEIKGFTPWESKASPSRAGRDQRHGLCSQRQECSQVRLQGGTSAHASSRDASFESSHCCIFVWLTAHSSAQRIEDSGSLMQDGWPVETDACDVMHHRAPCCSWCGSE